MPDRPQCGSCRDYIAGNNTTGLCYGVPPVVSLVVRIVTKDETREPDPSQSVMQHSSWGRQPKVAVDRPCCPSHQNYADWSKSYATGKPTPAPRPKAAAIDNGDDGFPF